MFQKRTRTKAWVSIPCFSLFWSSLLTKLVSGINFAAQSSSGRLTMEFAALMLAKCLWSILPVHKFSYKKAVFCVRCQHAWHCWHARPINQSIVHNNNTVQFMPFTITVLIVNGIGCTVLIIILLLFAIYFSKKLVWPLPARPHLCCQPCVCEGSWDAVNIWHRVQRYSCQVKTLSSEYFDNWVWDSSSGGYCCRTNSKSGRRLSIFIEKDGFFPPVLQCRPEF